MATDYQVSDMSFTRRQVVTLLAAVATVIIIVFGIVWWFKVWQSPKQVFWDMLSNNLTTTGVTRHIVETGGGQTLDEYIQQEFGATNLAHAVTTISQNNNSVSTETIGTVNTGFTRYLDLHTVAKNKSGQPLDFSKVVGVWSRTQASTTTGSPGLDYLFGQTLFGIVPIANLPAASKARLMSQLQATQVFTPDLNVSHAIMQGQRVYVYNVTVRPGPYAALMQAFARIEGYGTIAAFDPRNYSQTNVLHLQFAVSPRSHELVRILSSASHIEDYSSYGEQPTIALPSRTISASELEQRLLNVQ